jgi:hypothetical protein
VLILCLGLRSGVRFHLSVVDIVQPPASAGDWALRSHYLARYRALLPFLFGEPILSGELSQPPSLTPPVFSALHEMHTHTQSSKILRLAIGHASVVSVFRCTRALVTSPNNLMDNVGDIANDLCLSLSVPSLPVTLLDDGSGQGKRLFFRLTHEVQRVQHSKIHLSELLVQIRGLQSSTGNRKSLGTSLPWFAGTPIRATK